MTSFIANLCVIAAIGLTSYGAWLTYAPAGFICGGVWLALIGVGLVKTGDTQ